MRFDSWKMFRGKVIRRFIKTLWLWLAGCALLRFDSILHLTFSVLCSECVCVFRKSGCRKTLAIGKTSQTVAAYPKPARRRRREVKHKQNPTNIQEGQKPRHWRLNESKRPPCIYSPARVLPYSPLSTYCTRLDYSTLLYSLSLFLSRQQIIKSYDNDNIHKKPVFIPCVRLSNL